jgi:KUP system potassium uptake protein
VLHEQVVVMSVQAAEVPRASADQRLKLESLGVGFHRLVLSSGFMEEPDVPAALASCMARDLAFDMMQTSFFLSRETLITSAQPALPRWRESLFIALSGVAADATAFFHLPPNRVVERGAQVEI